MIQLGKILVPIDFSDSSEKAISYGLELARAFSARLLLAHVMELPFAPVPIGMGTVPPVMVDDIKPEVLERLKSFGTAATGVEVEYLLREGTPFVEIIQMARDAAADLIVMPTHGRSGLSHVLIGSTAERVVRKAPCPVLVVRDAEREFILP
ncbi:MAG: universal stress protein [Planctomycetes bacterium]|nr:universal stress protein [Planctomycetota bacterium]MCB9870087.1 universal stress protein [Planctomycetota bacterium]